MFERFTHEAREIVVGAQRHARRLGHSWIGCEHLLLAATESPPSPARRALDARGVTLERLTAALTDEVAEPATRHATDREALATLGINLDEVRDAAEAAFGPGALDRLTVERRCRRWFGRGRFRRRDPCRSRRLRASGHIPFTRRAKRCLELALREAVALKQKHIGADHIVLALLRCDDTMAWRLLMRLDVDPAALRAHVAQAVQQAA